MSLAGPDPRSQGTDGRDEARRPRRGAGRDDPRTRPGRGPRCRVEGAGRRRDSRRVRGQSARGVRQSEDRRVGRVPLAGGAQAGPRAVASRRGRLDATRGRRVALPEGWDACESPPRRDARRGEALPGRQANADLGIAVLRAPRAQRGRIPGVRPRHAGHDRGRRGRIDSRLLPSMAGRPPHQGGGETAPPRRGRRIDPRPARHDRRARRCEGRQGDARLLRRGPRPAPAGLSLRGHDRLPRSEAPRGRSPRLRPCVDRRGARAAAGPRGGGWEVAGRTDPAGRGRYPTSIGIGIGTGGRPDRGPIRGPQRQRRLGGQRQRFLREPAIGQLLQRDPVHRQPVLLGRAASSSSPTRTAS